MGLARMSRVTILLKTNLNNLYSYCVENLGSLFVLLVKLTPTGFHAQLRKKKENKKLKTHIKTENPYCSLSETKNIKYEKL